MVSGRIGWPTMYTEGEVYETTGVASVTDKVTVAVSRPPGPVARMEYKVADEAVVGVPAMEPVEPSSERPEGSEVSSME
jgi:hypothetical protein